MIKNFIFLGPPGVGKGTLASEVARLSNIVHISTGDIFRNEIALKTELGNKIKKILSEGSYVPDDITNQIILHTLKTKYFKSHGFILDGYPRTENQANFLIKNNIPIFKVILMEAPKELLIKRISGRRICPVCKTSYHIKFKKPKITGICDNDNIKLIQREDDKEEAIKKRFIVYKTQTEVLISFYKKLGLLVTIDGARNIETTLKDFMGKYVD